jgi:membrane protease subunit (stomatin/prohibitin family)
MGFIKSIQTSISGQYSDQFKEVIKSGGFDNGVIIKRVSTSNGVIQDKSRLFVEPGECAIMIDNGAIKDIVAEPGMYFMDTSAPTLFQTNIFVGIGSTFLESMKRIAYQGEAITEQFVFYINLAEQIGLGFGTSKPILYKDPTWGPIEISLHGQYAIKVNNPVNLLTNVLGNKDTLIREDLENAIRPYIVAGISSEVSNLGLSFDEIATKQDVLGEKLIESISEKLDSLGIELTKVVISNIDVPEEVKNSMRERTAIKMKATSVDDSEADIYAKLNKAEAMKDLANNPNSSGATIMGMNMGNMFASEIKADNNTNNNDK